MEVRPLPMLVETIVAHTRPVCKGFFEEIQAVVWSRTYFSKLMHGLCCGEANVMYLEPMAECARYLKESQKGQKK